MKYLLVIAPIKFTFAVIQYFSADKRKFPVKIVAIRAPLLHNVGALQQGSAC